MIQVNYPKRLCALFIALLLLFSLVPPSRAANASAYLDGALYPGAIHIEAGTSYLPMRHFFNHLGWQVTWDSASRTASAHSGELTLSASLPRHTLTVGDVTLDTKLLLRGGSMYVPLRTVCTFLGYDVGWNGARRIVTINSRGSRSWTEEELYWLSRIISAEARGESLTGQIAVGNVVLNRVESVDFPGTIPAVIFDRKHDIQFTPISNGTVYLPPTAQSVEAAKRALDGENTVGDALYFYAPALSQGVWINANRTYLMTIGCHRFYL